MRKSLRIGLVLTAVAVVSLFALRSSRVEATSSTNYKVTVRNDTGNDTDISLFTHDLNDISHKTMDYVRRIRAGETYTFETGSTCPFFLNGQAGYGATVAPACISGNPYPSCTAACFSSSWSYHSTGSKEYGFSRQ